MVDEALIVIDMQNDFCPGGALAVADGDQIVAGINAQIAAHQRVVLTQDWHPPQHQSFASTHAAAPFSMIDMPYGPQVLWPDHCIRGSVGAQLHSQLNTDAASCIIRKGDNREIDSYSAFFDNDHKTPTGLAGYLNTQGVTRLLMVGLATDYCVAWSALDARRLGFMVSVDLRLCRAIDLDGSLAKALDELREAGVTLID